MMTYFSEWAAESRRRAFAAYVQMLVAVRNGNQDDYVCWRRVRDMWLTIQRRIDRLLENLELRPTLIPLTDRRVLDALVKGIKAGIRAATLFEQKPATGSRLDLLAESWRIAANAYFDAAYYAERGDWDAASRQNQAGDATADGAEQLEESIGFEYKEPSPALKLANLPEPQPIPAPDDPAIRPLPGSDLVKVLRVHWESRLYPRFKQGEDECGCTSGPGAAAL